MNTEIVFEKARISAIEIKPASSGMSSRVHFIGLATANIAEALGAPWLLDDNGVVKSGFANVELEVELKNVRAKHSIEKIGALEMVSELATKFRIFRKGDDATRSKKKLLVSFQVNYAGALFDILEHLSKVGSGEGTCTLITLQEEMFPESQQAEPPAKKRGTQQTLASAADVEPKRKPKPMTRKTARDAARVDHALMEKGQEVYPD